MIRTNFNKYGSLSQNQPAVTQLLVGGVIIVRVLCQRVIFQHPVGKGTSEQLKMRKSNLRLIGSMIYRAFYERFNKLVPVSGKASIDSHLSNIQADRRVVPTSFTLNCKPDLAEQEKKEGGNQMILGTVLLDDMGEFLSEEEGLETAADYICKVIDNVVFFAQESMQSRKKYSLVNNSIRKKSIVNRIQQSYPQYLVDMSKNLKIFLDKHKLDKE